MKNKYLIILCTIIFCTLSILSSCKLGTGTAPGEETQKVAEVSETKETLETMYK